MCYTVSGSPEAGGRSYLRLRAVCRSLLSVRVGKDRLASCARAGRLEEESLFITFSGNCAHLFLIQYQHLTSGSFSKVNCNVEFEATIN